MLITIDIPGTPVAKGRPRFSTVKGIVRTHTPAKTKRYEELVQRYARQALFGAKPLGVPVYVKLYLYLPVPKSWSKKKKEMALNGEVLPTGRPDKDNFEKAIYDALNGIAWEDDSQITDSFTKKRYSLTPHAHVEVLPIRAFPANQKINREGINALQSTTNSNDAGTVPSNSGTQGTLGLVPA